MEEFLSPKYGIAGVLILLTIQVLMKVGTFLWEQQTKKETLTETTMKNLVKAVEDNTLAAKHLEMRLGAAEKSLSEIPKFKTDIRRFYSALKILAGDEWTEIRKSIMEDDLTP